MEPRRDLVDPFYVRNGQAHLREGFGCFLSRDGWRHSAWMRSLLRRGRDADAAQKLSRPGAPSSDHVVFFLEVCRARDNHGFWPEL